MAHKSGYLLSGECVLPSSEEKCFPQDVAKNVNKEINITNLPIELFQQILGYFSFGNISKFRLVSKYFDNACADLLNTEFSRLKAAVLQRYNHLKSQMPRRESSRRKHPLARENDIIETVHMRLALLNLTLGKHVEKSHCCFFAGEVLDEVNKLLTDLNKKDSNPSYKITDELFDLSTMAVEYFKDHIEPVLPQILYISEFLETSMSSAAKMDSCILKETDKTCTQKIQVGISEPALKELKKSLRTNTRIVNKNRRDINSMKLSLKDLNQNITNLESMIYQIKQQQKECKDIVLPKNNVNDLLKELIQCNHRIDSFESQLSGYQQSERKIRITNSISGIDTKTCTESDGVMQCSETSSNEKIFCNSSIPSSSSSSTIQSFAGHNKVDIKPLDALSTVLTRRPLKRKCKVISSIVPPKVKKSK